MDERSGLLTFWKNHDRKNVLRYAQMADELGYDSFWLPEAWGYEVFSLLTEMAVHTKNIKIGTGIVNVFSRSPSLLAMHAATLDEISEGRFILGLGTSGERVVGVDRRADRPERPVARRCRRAGPRRRAPSIRVRERADLFVHAAGGARDLIGDLLQPLGQ